jgi:hypothetical protein
MGFIIFALFYDSELKLLNYKNTWHSPKANWLIEKWGLALKYF